MKRKFVEAKTDRLIQITRHLTLGILLLPILFLSLAAGANAAPFAFISNLQSNTVSVIDSATNTVTTTVHSTCNSDKDIKRKFDVCNKAH